MASYCTLALRRPHCATKKGISTEKLSYSPISLRGANRTRSGQNCWKREQTARAQANWEPGFGNCSRLRRMRSLRWMERAELCVLLNAVAEKNSATVAPSGYSDPVRASAKGTKDTDLHIGHIRQP